ncbi:hypothetical protein N7492_007711 [Penicillium capsulatum]|uniref:Glutathione S-transferase n=1 Tax=Penicillium capsulatum TaxID=69766 RepID=A0A9W9LLX9_9EURO|nr:hypothetical protein N7492_007711 [Penicillium capsulatum]KAJ6117543.1 hypothetical protein N7512_007268 [Penicillium capsulatum]
MSDIKLYYFPGACSLASHILLHETGVPFTGKPQERSPFSEELRALNPKVKVPVLTIDGNVVTEGPAIMTAISSLAPEKNLTGAPGTLEAFKILEYLIWLSGTLHGTGYSMVIRPQRFVDNPAEHDNVKQKALEIIRGCYESIEQGLGKSEGEYAFGKSFTAVDAYLFVFWRWGSQIGKLDMDSLYPKYGTLAKAVARREATIAALKAEGLE